MHCAPGAFWVLCLAFFLFDASHEFSAAAKVNIKNHELGGYLHAADIVNLFNSANALVIFATAPAIAHLSDCFGRKPFLMYQCLSVLLSRLCLALEWPIFAYLAVDNLLPDAVNAVPFACIADMARERTAHERAVMFGVLAASGQLGSLTGYSLHLAFGGQLSDHAACLVSVLGFCAELLVLSLIPETHHSERAQCSAGQCSPVGSYRLLKAHWEDLWGLFGVTALLNFCETGVTGFLDEYNAYFFHITDSSYDVYRIFSSSTSFLCDTLGVLAYSRLLSNRAALVWSAAIDAISYIGLAFATCLWQCYALTTLRSLALWQPFLNTILVTMVPVAKQGEIQGAFAAFSSLVGFGAPSILAYTLNVTQCNWRGWVWLATAVPAIGAVMLIVWRLFGAAKEGTRLGHSGGVEGLESPGSYTVLDGEPSASATASTSKPDLEPGQSTGRVAEWVLMGFVVASAAMGGYILYRAQDVQCRK